MYPGQQYNQQRQQQQQQPQQQQYQQQPQQVQYVQQPMQQQYVQQPQYQQQQYVQQPMQQQQQFVQQPMQQQQFVQQPMYQQPMQQQQFQQQPMQQQYVQQQPMQQQQQFVQQPMYQQQQQPMQQQYVQKPQQQMGQPVAVYQQQVYGNQQPMMQQQQPIKKAPPSYNQHNQQQVQNNNKDDEKASNNIYEQADAFDAFKNMNLNDNATWSQPRPDAKGTVKAHANFNNAQAMEDAKTLRKAMKGLGCDKKTVAEVTGNRSHQQRLMIKNAFTTVDQELYGKGKNRDLLKDLKSELGGDYETLVMGLFMEKGEFDARLIKKAVDGAGFNTDLLVETLCTRTNEEISAMKSAWSTCLKEKKSMVQRCEGETKKMIGGNNFQHLILTILKGKRPINSKPDEIKVQKDAEELNRYITQAKTKEAKSKFVDVFTNRSWAHIGAIADKFQRISKKYTLPAAIKKTFGDNSDTSRALRVITHFSSEPYDYWAQKLRQSMKGLGTDDHMLIRIVVSRCEIDMDNVRNVFAKRYGEGQTLKKWIESDCSGSYRDLLNMLCGYGF